MEIILLENMPALGELGETVKVRPGFARNYLIPQGHAVPATRENIAQFEARRAELEKRQAEMLDAARAQAGSLEGLTVTIPRKCGEEGRLFGSVGTQDIAEAITASAGTEVRKHQVRLPAGVLRHTGTYPVTIHLHADVDSEVTVDVVPET